MNFKLPETWEKVRLLDVTNKIGSGATPRGGSKVYIENGINFIRSQNVLDFSFTTDGLVSVDDDAAEKLSNAEVLEKDILINITGDSVARTCIVPQSVLPARVNQHVSIIRVNGKKANYKYISYKLHDLKRQLLSYADSGGTRKALTKSMLQELEFYIPELNEQKSIAESLSALDNKIETNNKINENLEAQAQALFKHWFVDFEFPNENGEPYQSSGEEMIKSELGLIPAGWKIKKLKDVANVNYGDNLPRKKFTTDGYKVYGANGVIGYYKNYNYEKSQVTVGCRGTVGQIHVSEPYSFITNNSLILETKNESIKNYIQYYFTINDLSKYATGSVQLQLTITNMNSVNIIVPRKELLNNFYQQIYSLLKMKRNNNRENEALTDLRDTLLPKLVSGEYKFL